MNIDKLKQFIKKHNMLPPGSRVLCAVSGGADSVCLLHLLRGMEGIEAVCAHYNHCLRGDESQRDEQFVRSLCEKWELELVCGRGDVSAFAAEKGMSIEEAARKLRYDFLEKAAEDSGCALIATAHNADDNAETVLFNLARGSGLKGMCGIPPVRGRIVRPLLCATRAEIEAYLSEQELSHVEDSTNFSDEFSRNRIRHNILPALRRENAAAVENIFTACESLREDEEYLSALARSFINENLRDLTLPVSALLELPVPVMMRVFRLMCGGALSRDHAMSLRMLCLNRGVHASVDVPGMRVTKEFDTLRFGEKIMPAPLDPAEIRAGESVDLPEAGLIIKCEEIPSCAEIHKSFNTFFLNRGNIYGKLFVSSRKEGDEIRLDGRGCTKSLKKLFSESGLSLEKRILTPVIRDNKGVVAVAGFGIAERCAGKAGNDIIKITVCDINKEETDYD